MNKSKYVFLLLGIVIGLLIGVLFLLSNKSAVVNAADKPIVTDLITESMIERFAKKLAETLRFKKKNYADTLIKSNTLKYKLPKYNDDEFLLDTLNINTDSTGYNNPVTEEIDVKKDELISAKFIDIQETTTDITSAADSLLAIASKTPIKNSKSSIIIEFWMSPINYLGYKANDTKIIVFGLDPMDNIKIKRIENELYLKTTSDIFKIEQSNDFNNYRKVTSAVVINQFK